MTPILEIIFSGFVSKVVNDIVDISKDKIRKAVENKVAEHQNLESQIYNVIVDVLNKITDNRYENNQDNIYNAAEILLNSCKENKGEELKKIKSCLQILYSNVDEYKCMKFKMLLYEELGKNEYRELFRAILLLLLEQKSQYDYTIYEQLKQKSIEVEQKIDQLSQKIHKMNKDTKNAIWGDASIKFKGNKKGDYIKNWNSRMFLHFDNDEKSITLADAFVTPDYKMHNPVKRIGISENDKLDKAIEKFVEYDKTSTILITGEPGIGKSTITSKIANKYKDDERIIILRFKDWEREELEKGLLKAICNTLECRKKDLECRILVLDGFDEMKSLDIRDTILNGFLADIKDFENFKCIMTSRPAYIRSRYYMNIIELKEFDIYKVDEFCKKITGNGLNKKEKIKHNLEVLGIPVILYMAIMSGVDISENPTKPELYNRIFAEKGGIFDRFFDGENEYSEGSQIMRNSDNIKHYLKFLSETAFKMFEKKSLSLSKEEYEIPELAYQGTTVSVLEFPVKHLFENTSTNIEFIHKSIYEYFVSEYVINSIVEVLDENRDKAVNLACVLGQLLKGNELTAEIIEFLKYKVKNGILNQKFDLVNETFQLMLRDGMTYYTNICYKNPINCETNVFANMLEVLHLWEKKYYTFNKLIFLYIHGNAMIRFNLRNAVILDELVCMRLDLRYVDLREAYLRDLRTCKSRSDFRYADLRKADLIGINIEDSDFRYTDLRGAYLMGAEIKVVDLRAANLRGAHLAFAELEDIDLRGADLRGAYLTYAKLENVDLDDAYLADVVIDESQLAYLEEYNLKGTRIYIKGKGFYLL